MISIVLEINPALIPAAKQALVWGLGSAAASRVGNKKPLTPEEKKELRKHLAKQFAIGAVTGGVSTLLF